MGLDENLKTHFQVNFSLLYDHKIDFHVFDDLMPWERSIYLNMLSDKMKEENDKEKLRQQELAAKQRIATKIRR